MKKFITIIMLFITIMTMTGCSKKEETKCPFHDVTWEFGEVIIVQDVIEEDVIPEEFLQIEQDYKDGKISQEYYEECRYNSRPNKY